MKRDRKYPFQPGEAVYYVARTSPCYPCVGIPAVVVRVSGAHEGHPLVREIGRRVSIQYEDGHVSTVTARRLIYRGYCAACELPAHAGAGGLVCPVCGASLAAEPPPDHLVARWDPEMSLHLMAVCESVRTGHALREARRRVDMRCAAAYRHMAQRLGLPDYRRWEWPFTSPDIFSRFELLALLGDMAGARAVVDEQIVQAGRTLRLLRAGWAQAEQEIEHAGRVLRMPPFVPPADDRTPDGPDDTTRWLERQFRRAA
jgi:hypothetical protein